MRMIPLRPLVVWGTVCLSTLGLTGCPPSVTTIPQPGTVYVHPTADSYGNGETVDATEFDTLYLRSNDAFVLDLTQVPDQLPTTSQEISLQQDPNSPNLISIRHTPTSTGANHCEDIRFSQFNYQFHVCFGNYVWPGDANGDGRRNMLDVYPVAEEFNRNPLQMPAQPSAPPANLNRLYPRPGWSRSVPWAGGQVDLCHADANFDDILNEEDVNVLAQVLTPVVQPHFLADSINRITLKATPTGQVLRAGPRLLTIPYRISIDALHPPGSTLAPPPFMDMQGVVFTRPVTENGTYTVHSIHADLATSNLVMQADSMLGHQHYWRDIAAVPMQGCTEAVAKALDVGIFNRELTKTLAVNSELLNCGVTIDDILQPLPNGGTVNVNVYFHVYNGTVFHRDANGNVIATPAQCSSDTTPISVAEICPGNLMVREAYDDWGNEPYEDSLAMGASPDIWVRLAQDGDTLHEDPEIGQYVYVYVRMHNNGCLPFNALKEDKLSVYWTLSDPPLLTTDDLSSPYGGLVGSRNLGTSVGPFDENTMVFKWKVPDFNQLKSSIPALANSMQIGLVARIDSPQDPANPLSNLQSTLLHCNNFAIRYSKWTP